jgi:hypothetical protein
MYREKSLRKNDPARQLGDGTSSYEMATASRHTSRTN